MVGSRAFYSLNNTHNPQMQFLPEKIPYCVLTDMSPEAILKATCVLWVYFAVELFFNLPVPTHQDHVLSVS